MAAGWDGQRLGLVETETGNELPVSLSVSIATASV